MYAAVSIGKIGDERGIKPLLNVLNDDDDVSRSAIDALGKMGDIALSLLWSFLMRMMIGIYEVKL